MIETTIQEKYPESYPHSQPLLCSIYGNLLVMCQVEMTDEELFQAHYLSQLCWHEGRRIADGVVCFSWRKKGIRYCFFNPDGSFELICGNGLLAIGAILNQSGPSTLKINPFELPAVDFYTEANRYTLTVPVSVNTQPVLLAEFSSSHIHDTGSPHLVVQVEDVAQTELASIGMRITEQLEVNLTIYSVSDEKISARTYERGVNAETAACGTGAMAIALETHLCSLKVTSIEYPGGTYQINDVLIDNQSFVSLGVEKTCLEIIEYLTIPRLDTTGKIIKLNGDSGYKTILKNQSTDLSFSALEK